MVVKKMPMTTSLMWSMKSLLVEYHTSGSSSASGSAATSLLLRMVMVIVVMMMVTMMVTTTTMMIMMIEIGKRSTELHCTFILIMIIEVEHL